MSRQDRELWEYFAALYKNSNKGIKGRGRDRKISTTTKSGSSSPEAPNPPDVDEYAKQSQQIYEDSSYTGGSSSDEEDAELLCRQPASMMHLSRSRFQTRGESEIPLDAS